MLIKKIKNNDSIAHTWCGMEIPAGQYYQIQPNEEIKWAHDSELSIDIATGLAIVNDGAVDITDVNSAIEHLKNDTPRRVITAFEEKDKTLKLVSISGEVDQNGQVVLYLKIPGMFNSGEGRYISEGMAWFSQPTYGDKIVGIYFADQDDLLGYGIGTIVGSYTEDEMTDDNKGWYIPQPRNFIECETIGFYGFAPAGFYIKIIAQSGNGYQAGKKVYLNLTWGKVE